MPGGDSLATFLARRLGLRTRAAIPRLEEQILGWVDFHHAQHSVWPTSYSGEILGVEGSLFVEVVLGDHIVAQAAFTEHRVAAEVHCENVQVEEDHKKKGICTAIYVVAEKALGTTLSDFWKRTSRQSAEARAFWDQPDRPFGRRHKEG